MRSSARWTSWRRSSGIDPVDFRMKNFIKREQFPYQSALGLGIRFGRLSHRHAEGAGRHRLPSAARGAEGEAGGVQARRDPRTDGHRRLLLHRDRRRRAVEELRHPRHRDVRFVRDPHPSDRPGHRADGHRRARARATRRPGRRSSRPRSAFPPTTSRSRKAIPTPPLTASAPTARARRRSPAPRSRWRRARSRPRRR